MRRKGLGTDLPSSVREVANRRRQHRATLTIRQALVAGATKREITEVIWQMSMFGGLPAMQKALELAQAVFAETGENDA